MLKILPISMVILKNALNSLFRKQKENEQEKEKEKKRGTCFFLINPDGPEAY